MAMFFSVGLLIAVIVAAVVLAWTVGRSTAMVCAAAGVLLVGLTFAEAQLSDRWAESNVTAEEFAANFSQVPMTIGDWQGEDQPVLDEVLKKTGAVGYVSRLYRNERTGQEVTLWLIVGHARDICRHTPDVCYPSSGFHKQSQENTQHTIPVKGFEEPAQFFTNSFIREDSQQRGLMRVFWAWYKPGDNGQVVWQAPEYYRFYFGNSRALYKMYFSAPMTSPTQTADQSPCIDFAEEFLPIVDEALANEAAQQESAEA